MNPLNPIKPTVPSPRVRPAEDNVKRREPGTGRGKSKRDNPAGKPVKPGSDEHQIDELA